jgi:hypothetical protein
MRLASLVADHHSAQWPRQVWPTEPELPAADLLRGSALAA